MFCCTYPFFLLHLPLCFSIVFIPMAPGAPQYPQPTPPAPTMGSEGPWPRRRRSMVLRKRPGKQQQANHPCQRPAICPCRQSADNASPMSFSEQNISRKLSGHRPRKRPACLPLSHATFFIIIMVFNGIPIWDNARICLTLNLQHRWAVSVHLPLVFYPSKLPAATPRIDSANLNHWVDLRTVSGSPSFSIKSMPLNIKTLHAKLCWGGGVSDHITD